MLDMFFNALLFIASIGVSVGCGWATFVTGEVALGTFLATLLLSIAICVDVIRARRI